jgi:hypothetical protein
LVEGETDPKYLRTAAELLGFEGLLRGCEIQWVGSKREGAPQGFNTGASGLTHTFNVLSANPEVLRRRIVLVYDADQNHRPSRGEWISVLPLPHDGRNPRVRKGIENLLPPELFIDEYYIITEREQPDGGKRITKDLDKSKICDWICDERRQPADFEKFRGFLQTLEEIVCPGQEAGGRPAP